MSIAIQAENISKKYNLGTISSGTLFRDLNMYWAKMRGKANPYAKLGDNGEFNESEHWALRDVGFEIKQGEAVGIIGRNGAGKSTLLKILSRVTTPTTGQIKIRGRVASLLEVGTGFHPEMTGRENIFLNGAILGMTKWEIKKKFDEIVDFAGIEKYIDTPVKRYSSGMYVRLAFAVAAHLEPEILIVDEVLAVGDAEFQKKCLGKMNDVSKNDGRTVLFVSHNMDAVSTLCSKGIVLSSGKVSYIGKTQDAIQEYLIGNISNDYLSFSIVDKKLNEKLNLKYLKLSKFNFQIFENIPFAFSVESKESNIYSSIAMFILDSFQQKVAFIDLRNSKIGEANHTNPFLTISGEIKNIPFVPGIYSIGIHIQSIHCYSDFFNLVSFEVEDRISEVVPYPLSVRGKVEVDNIFEIVS